MFGSPLHALFRIVFELPLKHASKKFKAIPAVFLGMTMIAVCQLAFAQEASPPSSIKDFSRDQNVKSLTATVKDASTSPLAGTAATDEPTNHSLPIRFLEDHSLLASKPGYDSMSALDVIQSSDTIPDITLSISTNLDPQLKYRPNAPKRVLSWETGEGKSYLIPALEIPGFILVLNAFDRLVFSNQEENGKKIYSSNFSTFWDHLVHGPWGYDNDTFPVNQVGHPYQGTIYYGFARSAGLNFWESLGYTFLGSFLWETGGETTHPSVNDQVASGIAGGFFGEALFRMASLLLEGGGGKPGLWRELRAAVISPPTGFNRLVFGDRFKAVFPSRDPAIFQWVRLGEGLIVNNTGSNISSRSQTSLDYSLSYGLPGKPGYSYKRPFDYFQFELTAFSRTNYLNIATQGLLLGEKYEVGNSYRGIWGLYGSFDYISPQFFRVSSTATSLGTTAQWWLGPKVALQGTVLGGIGLGAGGKAFTETDRDYHYGITGQGLLALRLIFDDLAMINLTGRGYYISSLAGSQPKGNEAISHLEAGLFFRIYRHHALGIQYTALYRDGRYSGRSNVSQSQGTLSLVYALLSDTRFGAVEWRNGHSR